MPDRSCAWMAVIATVLTISATVQPRLRSLTGLLRPCSTGPMATALAERCRITSYNVCYTKLLRRNEAGVLIALQYRQADRVVGQHAVHLVAGDESDALLVALHQRQRSLGEQRFDEVCAGRSGQGGKTGFRNVDIRGLFRLSYNFV